MQIVKCSKKQFTEYQESFDLTISSKLIIVFLADKGIGRDEYEFFKGFPLMYKDFGLKILCDVSCLGNNHRKWVEKLYKSIKSISRANKEVLK
ncbi:MAG: hypothetical protein QME16_00235 [Planctomycetota bacterium]|nr:hypothetical protein [Planctomycetota bacterium]